MDFILSRLFVGILFCFVLGFSSYLFRARISGLVIILTIPVQKEKNNTFEHLYMCKFEINKIPHRYEYKSLNSHVCIFSICFL